MKNAVFGKTKKNVGKHRGIKIETTGDRKNNLVSNKKDFFGKNLSAIEMKRTQIHINKPVYLGLLILEICKIVTMSFGMII